jgi:mitosis inhibitor protein kinase SWE1
MHLPSPTHPHSYRLDGTHFAHLQELRRSLSRSPSKPSRFQLRKSDSPVSPVSPLALARAFSPKANKPTSPSKTFPESPLAQAVPAKKKFALRRPATFRASPRTRGNSKSPRRILGDSPTGGNSTTYFAVRPTSDQENTPARPSSASSVEHMDSMDSMDTDINRFGLNDKPIKFEFARRPDVSPPLKSSPLKRNDGVMNLSGSTGCSPLAKRRSLHAVSTLDNDFESIFDQTVQRNNAQESHESEMDGDFSFSSPMDPELSPLGRATSLRKSTLSQRGSGTPKAKPAFDGEFALPGPAASKTKNRMSLDASVGQSTTPVQTPFRKPTFDAGRMGLPQPPVRGANGAMQPHPLSHAQTPNSSTSSVGGFTPMAPPRAPHFAAPPPRTASNHQFSRSLPIGVPRPHGHDGEQFGHDFDTPFKSLHAAPVPFSTGLMSKKNRNVDEPTGVYVMPDTPSKRQSYPPSQTDRTDAIDTPLVKRGSSLFGNLSRPQPQFGTTSTPFSTHVSKFSTGSFGKGTSIFGDSGSSHQRRGSFVSIDGDDDCLPDSQSPTANRMIDCQSNSDDMPPTPTKGYGGSSRRSKESSLRRKTFRSRPSIGDDTFAAPDGDNTMSFGSSSPQSPRDASFGPDANRLSISGNRRGSINFNSSLSSFPPATPTTPRDHSVFFAADKGAIPIGLTKNDVDEALSSRFSEVRELDGGEGEFSKVYRVSQPVQSSPRVSPAGSQVWVVKKSRKPYLGAGDRQRKLREVEVLYALRGNDHVLDIKDHWEVNSHLYIQTEYCEGGNLRRFLDTVGYSSRLDDFRIWKILLELSMVSLTIYR